MKRVLTIVNGFVHDFAAGCWAASVLAVWWLQRAMPTDTGAALVLATLQRRFFWIGVGCTALVLATGAGRGFSYVDNFYGAAAEAGRRRLLVAKHLLLFGIFGAGTWWQFRIAFGH